MAALPTVKQFPTFMSTYERLSQKNFTCNWCLPVQQRLCRVTISDEDADFLYDVAENMMQGDFFPIDDLAMIAEESCCIRHHRDKMMYSELKLDLALRWRNETQPDIPVAPRDAPKLARVEESLENQPAYDLPSLSNAPVRRDQLRPETPKIEDKQLLFSTTPTLVEFSRHSLHPDITLSATVWSDIDESASKIGSVYIFTYSGSDWKGMIKIGYTARSIKLRLQEWTACGHGEPYLFDSVENIHHPERVELLVHLELMMYRRRLDWCDYHCGTHVEWFEVGLALASKVLHSWSSWMERANSYDRRGYLKTFWIDAIRFLGKYKICITGALMRWIEEVEEGTADVTTLLDDDALRSYWRSYQGICPSNPVLTQSLLALR